MTPLPRPLPYMLHTANQAMCNAAEKIIAGTADIVLAGGAETFSDLPIRFSRPIRCVGSTAAVYNIL